MCDVCNDHNALGLVEEEEDKLLGLKDINNYSEPNFIGNNDKLYLVRCYECDRENYKPNVPLGICTWCSWRYDPEILDYILELRKRGLPEKRGMTLDEIARRYPKQYLAAVAAVHHEETES